MEFFTVGTLLHELPGSCIRPGLTWGQARTERMAIPEPFTLSDLGRSTQIHGPVSKCTQPKQKGVVALKTIPFVNILTTEVPSSVLSEIIARDLDHPNVAGACRAGFASAPGYREPDTFVIIFELASGDLRHYMTRGKKLAPDELRSACYQMARAVAHLHSRFVGHFDIKPENLLTAATADGGLRLLLADLGLSCAYCVEPVRMHARGTKRYVPPELIFDSDMRPVGDLRADVWSLGMTFYFAATGEDLLRCVRTKDDNVVAIRDALLAYFGGPGRAATDRFTAMRRPNLDDPSHFDTLVAPAVAPYGRDFANLLQGMLTTNPDDRLTIFKVLNHPYFDEATKARVNAAMPLASEADAELLRRAAVAAQGWSFAPSYVTEVLLKMEADGWRAPPPNSASEVGHATTGDDRRKQLAAVVGKTRAEAVNPIADRIACEIIFHALLLFRGVAYDQRFGSGADIPDGTGEACFALAKNFRWRMLDRLGVSRAVADQQRRVLRLADFDVCVPTAFDFLLRAPTLPPDDWEVAVLMAIAGCMDERLSLLHKQSDIATLSIYAARGTAFAAGRAVAIAAPRSAVLEAHHVAALANDLRIAVRAALSYDDYRELAKPFLYSVIARVELFSAGGNV